MKQRLQFKLKSQKGFTMQDLLIACFVFVLFSALIGTLMYKVYEINVKSALTSQMCVYAVQILEDIDKISYEEAQTKTGTEYREQFSIPSGYGINLTFSNYGTDKDALEDVIKIVDLKLTYEIGGHTEEFAIRKLKIKEI